LFIISNDGGVAMEVSEVDLLVVICCFPLLFEIGEVGTVTDMDLFVEFATTGMGFFLEDLDNLAGSVFSPVVK